MISFARKKIWVFHYFNLFSPFPILNFFTAVQQLEFACWKPNFYSDCNYVLEFIYSKQLNFSLERAYDWKVLNHTKRRCATMIRRLHPLASFKFVLLRASGDWEETESHVFFGALKTVLLERTCIFLENSLQCLGYRIILYHIVSSYFCCYPGKLAIFSEFCISWTADVDSTSETWFSVFLLQKVDIRRPYLSYLLLFLPMHLWESRSDVFQFTFTNWCISPVLCPGWEIPQRHLIQWL